jgi:antitoxin (DNA-binding transcriptional repressor) of toxin-antitoxin stability system
MPDGFHDVARRRSGEVTEAVERARAAREANAVKSREQLARERRSRLEAEDGARAATSVPPPEQAAGGAGNRPARRVHGRPVADILPRVQASERRPSELLLADLETISAKAAELGVKSDAADFEVGWTTDDLLG